MELTEYETKIVEMLRAYESAMTPVAQGEASEALIGSIMDRFEGDDIMSVWYGIRRDRVNRSVVYLSWSTCDAVTLLGLRELVLRWASNEAPPAVQVREP